MADLAVYESDKTVLETSIRTFLKIILNYSSSNQQLFIKASFHGGDDYSSDNLDNLSEWYKYIREWREKTTLESDPAVYEKEKERDRKMKRYNKLHSLVHKDQSYLCGQTKSPLSELPFIEGWILNNIRASVAIPAFARLIDEEPSTLMETLFSMHELPASNLLITDPSRTYKNEEKESRLESDLELDPAAYKREKREISLNGHKQWGTEFCLMIIPAHLRGRGTGENRGDITLSYPGLANYPMPTWVYTKGRSSAPRMRLNTSSEELTVHAFSILAGQPLGYFSITQTAIVTQAATGRANENLNWVLLSKREKATSSETKRYCTTGLGLA